MEVKILDSFEPLIEKHDAFIFDAYGVFNLNGKISKPSIDVMENIVKTEKPLYILSNTTAGAASSVKSYDKKGVFKGIHYTEIFTSGEFGRKLVLSNEIPLNGKKVYIYGVANFKNPDPVPQALADTGVIIVDNPKDAEFAYCGIPQIDEKDIEYFPTKSIKENAELYMQGLKEMVDNKLPLVVFNPDLFAMENGMKALRQGTIALAYKELGGETIVSGKPDTKIYGDILKSLEENYKITDPSKILMVGDTGRTDIIGAEKLGLSTCLLMRHGVSYMEFVAKRKSVRNESGIKDKPYVRFNNFARFVAMEKVKTDYIVRGLV